jgi:hypothetical protein
LKTFRGNHGFFNLKDTLNMFKRLSVKPIGHPARRAKKRAAIPIPSTVLERYAALKQQLFF